MKRRTAVLAGLAMSAGAFAYPDGAPPGHTGGFGEASCHSCHFDGAPLDEDAPVRLEGLPARFEPGREYTITLALESPAPVHGFQLSARDPVGRQAGRLAAVDEATRAAVHDGVEFLGQTAIGSRTGGTWTFTWRAPDGVRQVLFHVAAVAGNDDRSEFGDQVLLFEALSSMERR